jgi:hypothetical protein
MTGGFANTFSLPISPEIVLSDLSKQIVDDKKVMELVEAAMNYPGQTVPFSMYVNGPFVQLDSFKESRPFDTRPFPNSRHVAFSELKRENVIFLSQEGEMIYHVKSLEDLQRDSDYQEGTLPAELRSAVDGVQSNVNAVRRRTRALREWCSLLSCGQPVAVSHLT